MSGRAMAQMVSQRPPTAEALVRAWVIRCEICCGQSGTKTGFSPSSLVFSCQYHSTSFHTHISSGGRTISPLDAAVQRRSLTPSTYKEMNKETTSSTGTRKGKSKTPTHFIRKPEEERPFGIPRHK
jgi:hypothetical protein